MIQGTSRGQKVEEVKPVEIEEVKE